MYVLSDLDCTMYALYVPYLRMCTSMAYAMVCVLCTDAAGGPSSPEMPQPNTGTSGGSQSDNISSETGGISSFTAQGGKKNRKKITKADISCPGQSNFV